jgi:hypothetical protein
MVSLDGSSSLEEQRNKDNEGEVHLKVLSIEMDLVESGLIEKRILSKGEPRRYLANFASPNRRWKTFYVPETHIMYFTRRC